uniref:Harbinger transposase derived 1 n=1 Tax=Cynoglossus semilaevis TaxID=244447 RepID=A0A3P8X4P2_CYNSE
MESNPTNELAPLLALIGPVLSSTLPAEFELQLFEQVRLKTSLLLRRRRLREQRERQRRTRQYLRRRRAFLLSSLAAALSLLSATDTQTVVPNPKRRQNFWTMAQRFNDDEFKSQFHVSRSTFDHLLQLIGPAIKRKETTSVVPIEPGRRLAITLWWLARSGEYRGISGFFGVGVGTVCSIIRQVCTTIVERLLHRFVSLPSDQQLDETLQAFKDRCYPQCAGAIGVTHIPVTATRKNPEQYLNKNGWHSVILFTDVHAGCPGSSSSTTVLSSSSLSMKAVEIHLIGDVSFPLKPWLMKGYSSEEQLTSEQRRFSFTLSSGLSVVDAAFACLRGRWRCLLKKVDMDMAPKIITTCCILHNICEVQGDHFLPEWNTEVRPLDGSGRQPDMDPSVSESYGTAEAMRDTIQEVRVHVFGQS